MFFSEEFNSLIKIKKIILYSIIFISLSISYNVNLLCFADSISAKPLTEYDIKAAFLFKFNHFIDFHNNSGEKYIIGILGENPFQADILKELEKKEIKGKKIEVRFLDEKKTDFLNDVSKCRMLYISSSLKNDYQKIFESIKHYPVLTVGEGRDFIEKGGMIGFLLLDKNVRFEVNLKAIEKSGLKITDVSILRIATYVIR